jgi:hypothetical protein
MKCEDVIAAIIDGKASPLKKGLEQHLAGCEVCRKEAAEFMLLLDKMDQAPLQQPPARIATAFHDLLRKEITAAGDQNKLKVRKRVPVYLQIAAAVTLLLLGTWLGRMLTLNKPLLEKTEVTALKAEVQSMKEKMLVSLTQNESASQRIQAVSYFRETPRPDAKVLAALLRTLNKDKSINVRLAALYALQGFSTDPLVRDGLTDALEKQHDPVIQVVLIRMLTAQRAHRANTAIRKLLEQDKLNQDVKHEAMKSVKSI